MRERRYNIDLGGHLAQCDGNYLRLTKLMPELFRSRSAASDHAPAPRLFRMLFGGGAPEVSVEVEERSRYTSMATLTMPAGHGMVPLAKPLVLKVRLYHDAQCAEVVEFQGQRRFEPVYRYPNAKMRQPDEKAQLNRFLADFLNICLRHGVAAEQPAAIMGS